MQFFLSKSSELTSFIVFPLLFRISTLTVLMVSCCTALAEPLINARLLYLYTLTYTTYVMVHEVKVNADT